MIKFPYSKIERIQTWLNGRMLPADLKALSDRALQDMGVVRHKMSLDLCKPFWMA